MKLKLITLAAVFAAGMTASIAFAHGHDGGNGQGEGPHNRCTEVHLRGTIAPQTLNVTLDGAPRRLNVAPGTTVQVQLGGAPGQVVRFNAEACQVTTGTSTVLQVKEAELAVRTPRTTTTTGTTTGHETTTTGTTTGHDTTTTGHDATTATGTTATVTTRSDRPRKHH